MDSARLLEVCLPKDTSNTLQGRGPGFRSREKVSAQSVAMVAATSVVTARTCRLRFAPGAAVPSEARAERRQEGPSQLDGLFGSVLGYGEDNRCGSGA